jgi:uncharacterized membrane protein YgcG
MLKQGFFCLVAGAFWLAAAGRLGAVAPQINDEGHFFSEAAIKKANQQIHDIARDFGRDLLIETYASAPKEQVDKLKTMSREERSKFFHNWALERMQAAVVNGVYVMACKDPPHLQVEITPGADAVFDRSARDKLVQTLLTEFKAQRFDAGLEAAVNLVRQQLAATSPRRN